MPSKMTVSSGAITTGRVAFQPLGRVVDGAFVRQPEASGVIVPGLKVVGKQRDRSSLRRPGCWICAAGRAVHQGEEGGRGLAVSGGTVHLCWGGAAPPPPPRPCPPHRMTVPPPGSRGQLDVHAAAERPAVQHDGEAERFAVEGDSGIEVVVVEDDGRAGRWPERGHASEGEIVGRRPALL